MLIVAPTVAWSAGRCDALRRVVSLNGDFGALRGRLLDEHSTGDWDSRVQLDPHSNCTIFPVGGRPRVFTCAWVDAAIDVPDSERAAVVATRTSARAVQIERLIHDCLPAANSDEAHATPRTSAYLLPSVSITVERADGPAVILTISTR